MSYSETFAQVDSAELEALKERMKLEIDALIDSFDELKKQYEEVAESGWEDDNQQSFEEELNELKQGYLERISDYQQSAIQYLQKKIEIIEEYTSL